MASELNNAFIPGVGAVQAEVARPRTKPVVGTEQGWSESGSDTSAHLLRAAVPKMQAAPMESAFSPPAAPMECVLPPGAPMESVLPKGCCCCCSNGIRYAKGWCSNGIRYAKGCSNGIRFARFH